jgi:beta-mannosidase
MIFSLSDTDWIFRQSSENRWEKAKIPGTVHTDLLNLGIIKNPFFGVNEKKYQWIGEKDWEYESKFIIPDELFKKDNIELVFEGIDTYADIYLNDKLILKTDNFFRKWVLNIKNKIKNGKNILKIKFTSPLKIIKRKKLEYPYGKTIADYIFIRKPVYHFGWDWAPRLITMGIWKPAYIKGWNNLKLKSVHIIRKSISTSEAHLNFRIEILSTKKQMVGIKIDSKTAKIKIKRKLYLEKGINYKNIELKIKNPKLWWPHNIGEPYLYDFSVKLYQGRKIRGVREIKTGIRNIKLIREKDKSGESFYFEINGIPVFIKGANYVPQDIFLNRVKKDDYEKIIKYAIKSNINMLRVWGGGFYENNIFYELCDKYGILVWQDFMFACAMYPANNRFLNNVKKEAIYNIKRLRNHPSIALWCGNNENYEGWNHWGWQNMYSEKERKNIIKDYNKLFLKLLPESVKEYDGERDYIHTSPITNWGGKLNTKGDVHYWGIWHGKEPFENFTKAEKIGRFVSEYGFQSFPSFKSIKQFTIKKERAINSESLKLHEKHPIGFKIINKYMKDHYKKPKDFKNYIFVSQLLQADGISIGIEAHRRAMPDCMGTLYWQFNDCWPAVSWSGIDWFGRWKPLQYKVKKLYSNIIISPFIENNNLKIYIISDKLTEQLAVLNLELRDFKGKLLWKFDKRVKIFPRKSKIYYENQTDNIIKNQDKRFIVLRGKIYDNNGIIISERYFYFVKPKELLLEKPVIDISINKTAVGYKIGLKTDKFAKSIYLSFIDCSGFFTDNYFDLLPGEIKTIEFITESIIDNPKKRINIISLFDSYYDD